MDELLEQLVFQVQQYLHETEERQKALRELAERILRSRQIARPPRGQPLSGVYLDILQAVQRQLQQDIDQSIDRYNPRRIPVKDWANGLRESAFQNSDLAPGNLNVYSVTKCKRTDAFKLE